MKSPLAHHTRTIHPPPRVVPHLDSNWRQGSTRGAAGAALGFARVVPVHDHLAVAEVDAAARVAPGLAVCAVVSAREEYFAPVLAHLGTWKWYNRAVFLVIFFGVFRKDRGGLVSWLVIRE